MFAELDLFAISRYLVLFLYCKEIVALLLKKSDGEILEAIGIEHSMA